MIFHSIIKFLANLIYMHKKVHITLSIRIVADCVVLTCQVVKKKLKRAKTLYFTTDPAIIFIHCCAVGVYYYPNDKF